MTVADRRAVAGLVWGTVAGLELTDADRAVLEDGLGGVVLFSRNVRSPAQLVELTAAIRAAASNRVVIAIDQEGGHIIRVGEPLTRLPSPMAIGATDDASLAYAVAQASAMELAACGIDVALAPVLDIAAERRSTVVGARSYGADPERVARLGAAAIRGYLDGGVLPVAKHFPGHGRTAVDSHLDLPVVAPDPDGEVELVPYEAAVAAGVPALMTAHVVHSRLDPRQPASLSRATTQLAREHLRFDGLIVTDAIVMDAVAKRRSLAEASVEALAAGADVVMALEPSARVIDRLVEAVARGELAPDALAGARRRAAAFAEAASAVRTRAARRDIEGTGPIGSLAHRRIAAEAARRSLTLVDGASSLPLGRAAIVVVDIASTRPSPVEDAVGSGRQAASVLAGGLHADLVSVDAREPSSLAAAVAAAALATHVVVLSRDAYATEAAASAVAALAGPRAIHVALRNPVDLEVAWSSVRIATYHEGAEVGAALAAALRVGPAAFPGRLPITLDLGAGQPAAPELAS